jgi:hypothetical protein
MKEIYKVLILLQIILLGSCANKSDKLLKNAIEISGSNFNSDWINFHMTGNYSYAFTNGIQGVMPDKDGIAKFIFHINENILTVRYTASTRIEELEGKIKSAVEEYKLSNFKEEIQQDYYFSSRKIVADWGQHHFECYLKKYLPEQAKPTLNQTKEILNENLYVLHFEVVWGSGSRAILETTELSKDQQDALVKMFRLKNENNDNLKMKLDSVSKSPDSSSAFLIDSTNMEVKNAGNYSWDQSISAIAKAIESNDINALKEYIEVSELKKISDFLQVEEGRLRLAHVIKDRALTHLVIQSTDTRMLSAEGLQMSFKLKGNKWVIYNWDIYSTD